MDRYGRYPMTTLKQMVYTLLLAGRYFGASWRSTQLGRDIGFALAISPAAGIALGALLCYGPGSGRGSGWGHSASTFISSIILPP